MPTLLGTGPVRKEVHSSVPAPSAPEQSPADSGNGGGSDALLTSGGGWQWKGAEVWSCCRGLNPAWIPPQNADLEPLSFLHIGLR